MGDGIRQHFLMRGAAFLLHLYLYGRGKKTTRFHETQNSKQTLLNGALSKKASLFLSLGF